MKQLDLENLVIVKRAVLKVSGTPTVNKSSRLYQYVNAKMDFSHMTITAIRVSHTKIHHQFCGRMEINRQGFNTLFYKKHGHLRRKVFFGP